MLEERVPIHGPAGRCLGVFACEITPHGRDHHATSPDRLGCHRSGIGNHTDPASAAQCWADGRGHVAAMRARTAATPRDAARRLLPSITQGIHDVLGCLFCCPGLNARHDIYRAALCRNDFGKCSKFLPIYSCRKCCCGRVSRGLPALRSGERHGRRGSDGDAGSAGRRADGTHAGTRIGNAANARRSGAPEGRSRTIPSRSRACRDAPCGEAHRVAEDSAQQHHARPRSAC